MYGCAKSIFYSFLGFLSIHSLYGQECLHPPTIDFSIHKILNTQPNFLSFLPKTEENMLLDNVCVTFMPLADDPNTIIEHDSFVYCDGSNYVESFIVTSIGKGTTLTANPRVTYLDYFVGYAGCDTFIGYRCSDFGEYEKPHTFGVTKNCRGIGLSCLRKIEEIIENAGLPLEDMYVLPMKLPNRCVNQAACIIPPNPFYNKLGPSVGLVY
ncbi:uncharacterized protein LOC128996106 [Macrosteles quadrilineatus]|uniref:uncharacterized protein LOC128996106 n=1 Tax=Macrosteles quadrilineatus TaxID=74068 RepID=UPI0023E1E62C|nr:uncharacterized protein LOC128996106 [Macrosteles quadrilineatus]